MSSEADKTEDQLKQLWAGKVPQTGRSPRQPGLPS